MLEQLLDDGPIVTVTEEQGLRDDNPTAQELPDRYADAAEHREAADAGTPVALDTPALPRDVGDRGIDDGDVSPDVNRGAKRVAVWLGCGAAVVAVLLVVAFVGLGGAPEPAAAPSHHGTVAAMTAVPTTTSAPPAQDQALPYYPWSSSCSADGAAGDQLAARSAQALTDTSTDSAWVCGRGPQESRLDGQVLHVQFICDPSRPNSACSYMLNSLSLTPGWVAKTQGGKDEWLQHRVVTNLQFNFFNGNELVSDPLPVETHSTHGPVSVTLPRKVLASRVDVIILHTDRPPLNPLPTSSTLGPGAPDQPPTGLLDSLTGTAGTEPASPPSADPASGAATGNPVDATFAMSQLSFFGHSPN